jgi:hypothetical protein
VRVATWYRIDPDEVERHFSPCALRLLWVAEDAAPWGEAAMNLRMEYMSEMMVASSDGYAEESRRSAQARATMILRRLKGQPEPSGRKKSNVSAVTGR